MQLTNNLGGKPPLAYLAALLIILAPLYYISYQYHLRHPYDSSSQISRPAEPSTPDFTRHWLSTHIVSPFNSFPLKRYCNQSEWYPNLVFNLANANGGIGNIRGNHLDFIFQSIEAGASIILPGMAARASEDISNVWASRSVFDTFFDEEWFLQTMTEVCPQMSIYKPERDQPLKDAVPGIFYPRSRRLDEDFENNKGAYIQGVQAFLDENSVVKPDDVILVNLERTLFDIDTRSLPTGFRRSFGQLLKINPRIRRLAAVVVQQLSLKFNVVIDPRDAIPKQAFYGAHLRTEADAQNAGWLDEPNTNFSAQTDAYINEAIKHKLKTIYVATGNATDLNLFRHKALNHSPSLNVTSKLDLLPPNELAVLKDLTWDQQALVDYEVLQRCSVFGGMVKSSFSYNIAMTRSQWLEDQGRVTDPWMVQHTEDGVSFDDGISRILARDAFHEARIPRGMWP